MTVAVTRSFRTLTIRFVGTEQDGLNLQKILANSGMSIAGVVDALAACGYQTTVSKPRASGFISLMEIPQIAQTIRKAAE